jgi:hypothetical protein
LQRRRDQAGAYLAVNEKKNGAAGIEEGRSASIVQFDQRKNAFSICRAISVGTILLGRESVGTIPSAATNDVSFLPLRRFRANRHPTERRAAKTRQKEKGKHPYKMIMDQQRSIQIATNLTYVL